MGTRLGRVLGAERTLEEAGVTVRLRASGQWEKAHSWTRSRQRVGAAVRARPGATSPGPPPRARIEVEADASALSPARLGTDNAMLGANAFLNVPRSETVSLRLAPVGPR